MANKKNEGPPSNADVDLFVKSRNAKYSEYHGDQRPGDEFPDEAASLTVQELGDPVPNSSTVTKVVNKDD